MKQETRKAGGRTSVSRTIERFAREGGTSTSEVLEAAREEGVEVREIEIVPCPHGVESPDTCEVPFCEGPHFKEVELT